MQLPMVAQTALVADLLVALAKVVAAMAQAALSPLLGPAVVVVNLIPVMAAGLRDQPATYLPDQLLRNLKKTRKTMTDRIGCS